MAGILKRISQIGLILTAALFAGCKDANVSMRILVGNMSFSGGRYQKSILHYLVASDLKMSDVIHYNLANVYYALGEGNAALNSWSRAEEITEDVDVLFRIAFNKGVLYYQWGRFDDAYKSFRRALKINPGDRDSKINLEESFLRMRSVSSNSSLEAEAGNKEVASEGESLLNYVRMKEMNSWNPQQEPQKSFAEDW